MLGCGTLVVESAGERGQLVLRDVPHVEEVQRDVYRLAEADEDQRRHGGGNHGPQDDRGVVTAGGTGADAPEPLDAGTVEAQVLREPPHLRPGSRSPTPLASTGVGAAAVAGDGLPQRRRPGRRVHRLRR